MVRGPRQQPPTSELRMTSGPARETSDEWLVWPRSSSRMANVHDGLGPSPPYHPGRPASWGGG
jgi:hypothetical protein